MPGVAKEEAPRILTRRDGTTIAYRQRPGKGPGVVFCGGYKSDMTGTKATALEAHCAATGRAFLRFDYRGHGASSGRFEDGTISDWTDDAIACLDMLTKGPQILVGSSMGGWIMMLAARARPDRVAALIGIAAAPDFTEDLMWANFDPATRDKLQREGRLVEPSAYDPEPYVYTYKLIEDGRRNLVLRAPFPFAGPARLLQGMKDPDVPWRHAIKVVQAIRGDDVALSLIKEGDHRLSTPDDLARLTATIDDVAARLAAA
ncbi:MAG: alpha/beta hydrolase [Alphaproteobacteria bacterium]|nr:alpha/beta hydrolase [Alphaproteobacteria bacterium]